MNIPQPTLVLPMLLAAVAPSQSRQLEAEAQRQVSLVMPGRFLAMAYGDIDLDGDLDAVAASVDPWFLTASVTLLRQQAGAWQPTGLHSVPGFSPFQDRIGIVLADLDGDGSLDVVICVEDVSGAADTRVVCVANDGAGAFAPGVTLPFPGATRAAIAVADVDGDTDHDLVLAIGSGGGSPLQLFAHDGAFGFQAVANAFPATPATTPHAFDFEHDGDLDVVGIGANGEVRLFTNTAGSFADTVADAVPTAHVVGGDLDGDGDGDLLVQRTAGAIVLLRNFGGALQPQTLIAAGVEGGVRPRLADVDGDLDLDAVVYVDYAVHVLRNDGAAAFADELVAAATEFAVGDADQDGVCDLLLQVDPGVAGAFGRTGGMLIDPALHRRSLVARATTGFADDVADFGGDLTIDVLQQTYYQVFLRRNHGVGEWSTILLPVPFLRPHARAIDVDGDGDLDIAVVDSDLGGGGLQVFRNDGGWVFSPLPVQALPYATVVGKGDFDGDGRGDLLLTDWSSLQIVSGTPGGSMSAPVTVFSGSADWVDTGVWDFEGDGDLDLLIKLSAGYCVQLMANDGQGNFSVADPCVAALAPGASTNMTLVDIDDDGAVDIFSCGYGSGRLFRNAGGVFTPGQVIHGVEGASLLKPHFADWDGDGHTDLLQLGGPAQLWLNDGSGSLFDASAARISHGSFSAAGVADLDGDGDPDPLGVSGFQVSDRVNHLRSATSTQLVTTGGQMAVRYAHEPGYAAGNTICIPLLSLDRRSTPLAVPGFEGTLQIDLLQSVLLPFLALPAPSGTATSSFAIPNAPHLLGFDLYAQGLVLAGKIAWTPATHERIL